MNQIGRESTKSFRVAGTADGALAAPVNFSVQRTGTRGITRNYLVTQTQSIIVYCPKCEQERRISTFVLAPVVLHQCRGSALSTSRGNLAQLFTARRVA